MKTVIKERLQLAAVAIYPGLAWQPAGFLIAAVVAAILVASLPLQWAAILLVAIAVLILILVEPLVGLTLALLAGPFGALENVKLGGSVLDSGQLLLMLTFAAWIAKGMLRRRILLRPTRLNAPILVFILATALSVPGAAAFNLGVKELLKWIEIILVMMMVVDMASSSEERGNSIRRSNRALSHRDRILLILLLAGLSQALIGIWQFGLRGTGPEHFSILGRFYRAYGTYEQPNPFGGFMNLTTLLALGALIGQAATIWQSWEGNKRERDGVRSGLLTLFQGIAPSPSRLFFLAVVVGTTVASLLALIFSWSRGAWLGFAAGIAVLLLFLPKRRWHGWVLLVGVAALGAGLFLVGTRLNVIPSGVTVRISNFSQDLRFGDVRGVDISDANYAVVERLAHWQAALDMAQNNLWLGVGFGNYQAAYADYALINWPDALGHAHNYYLNILAEAGVVGLAAYLILWSAVILQTGRLLKRMEWPRRGVVLGLLAAWLALSVHHLTDKLYVNNIYVHLGVMLGLLQLHENSG